MGRTNMVNNYLSMYNKDVRNFHSCLWGCTLISLFCIGLSLWLLFSNVIQQFILSRINDDLLDIWFSFAKFIKDNFNPIVGTLGGIFVSVTILFLKGKNKQFYLQLTTFFYAVPWGVICWIILFSFSFILQVYATEKNRFTSATILSFSLIVLLFCIIWYVIRYNNEKRYLLEDQSQVVLKVQKKPKKLKKYLYLLFPNNPEVYNNIDNDIIILKMLLFNVKFPSCGDRNLEEEQINEFFQCVVIPILAHLNRTYHTDREDLILALQTHLSQDFSNNCIVNKKMRYLLMVISCQYLVETEASEIQNEKRNLIIKWLRQMQKLFSNLYGEIYANNDINEFSNNYECLYKTYVDNLCEQNLLQINAYYTAEHNFIRKRKILPTYNLQISLNNDDVRLCYCPNDIVFTNIEVVNVKNT